VYLRDKAPKLDIVIIPKGGLTCFVAVVSHQAPSSKLQVARGYALMKSTGARHFLTIQQ
jgi:hypothetical protein